MKNPIITTISNIMERLSLRTLSKVGRGIGTLMWYGVPERRKRAIENISLHLKLSRKDARKLAKENFKQTGQAFLEIFYNPQLGHEFIKKNISIEQPHLFEKLLKNTRPIVAATGHIGAWELLSGLMAVYFPNRTTQIVVREPENETLKLIMRRLRGRGSHEIVPRDNSTPRILRALKQGGISAFLVDHNCGAHKAVFLPFFQKIAAVNFGPALIAIRARALVWPLFLIRGEEGKYLLHLYPPLDTTILEGNIKEKIKQVALFYTKAVENIASRYPTQWYWIHNRWRTRPPEEGP